MSVKPLLILRSANYKQQKRFVFNPVIFVIKKGGCIPLQKLCNFIFFVTKSKINCNIVVMGFSHHFLKVFTGLQNFSEKINRRFIKRGREN
jgi:hypothetical protein